MLALATAAGPAASHAGRPDAAAGRVTPAVLADIEDRRDPDDPRLPAALKSRSPALRARALRALGRIGAARSLPPVLAALSDLDAGVRAEACFDAGLIADSAALPALERAGHDSNPEVRRRAVEAASKLGTRRAATVLAAAMQDTSRIVRYEALTGMWRLQDSTGTGTLQYLAGYLDFEPDGPNQDAGGRWRAVYALEKNGSRVAGPTVLFAMKDHDPSVRMMAARAIGRLKYYEGAEALAFALGDSSWQVRVNAAAALGALADTANAPLLLRSLIDSSAYVRQTAATSLGAMKFSGACAALAALSRDPVPAVRAAAGVALVKILGASGAARVNDFMADSVAFVQGLVLEARGEAHDRGAWDFASWALEHAAPRVQTAALDYFSSMRDGQALPMVLKALQSRDDLLASNAAATLAETGDSSRVEDLVALYDRWPGDGHVDARLAAVDAVKKLYPKHMPEFFRRAVRDSDPRVRASAAEGLKAATGDSTPERVLVRPLPARRSGWFAATLPALPKECTLVTTRGEIRIALETEESPNTVANFVRLARKGYFNGITWHRVVPNFVIQGGDPHGDGQGGPGYSIRCEMNPIGYDRGRVGMALAGKDTGGSQFFITQSPQPHLNGRYTIFGRVLQGMDVVDRTRQGDCILQVRVGR